MKAIYFILPSILIIGGFIGMGMSFTGAGWAVILGLILYPTGIGYTEKTNKDEKNN